MVKRRGALSSVAVAIALMVPISMALMMLATGPSVATVEFDADLQQVSEGASFWICTMVVDSHDVPKVLYHDSGSIYYAEKEGGKWSTTYVDSIWEDFDVALGPKDDLNMCYIRYNMLDDVPELVYARNGGGSWSTTVLATGWEITGGSIAVDPADHVHICYHNTYGDLIYMSNAAGSWKSSMVVNDVDTSNGQVFIRGQSQVNIVYTDVTHGYLRCATSSGSGWSKQTIDDSSSTFSLALTPGTGENAHLCYMGPGKALKHAVTDGGLWSTEAIVTGVNASKYQVAVGPDDQAHVVYVDEADGDLKCASAPEGTWSTQVIDQGGDIGTCHIAIDADGAAQVTFNYLYGDLMYATDADGAWGEHIVDHSETGVISNGQLAIGLQGRMHFIFQRAPTNEIYYGSFTPSVKTSPGAPEGVNVTFEAGHPRLTWSPPADNGSADIISYQVYRGTSSADMTVLASLEGTSFDDAAPTLGTTYLYQVSAVNAEGEGTKSEMVNITLSDIPSAPTNLTLSGEEGHLVLDWDAPASDGGSPVTGYQVYRGTNGSAMGFLAKVDNTSYEDEGVQDGVTYYYSVVATNALGTGQVSGAVNGALKAPSAPADDPLPIIGIAAVGIAAVAGVLVWRRGKG